MQSKPSIMEGTQLDENSSRRMFYLGIFEHSLVAVRLQQFEESRVVIGS